jgi:excisionase family DNA binding protein
MKNTDDSAAIPASFDDRLLVGSRDAARLLSISERTLWSLVNEGQIACIRIGTCKRYSLSALEAFIAARSQSEEEC